MGGGRQDPVSNADVDINLEHTRVHDGSMYTAVSFDSDVDNAAPKWWIINAPDSAVRVHIKIQIDASDEFLVEFSEAATADTDGAAVTPRNCDRNSGNDATATFGSDPTNPAAGATMLFQEIVGSANNKTRVGGNARNGAEWILKRNTKYAIKVTPTNDNTKVSMVAEFYEV
ncbi:hypothetical protein LCGC14_1831770 [marine sediment metagenome]|uniref:Uncharacterized protein n=1 Tax=marine sediment metagenome TaxID=412755 RepID=A0A0F9IVB6_9ZZZZ